MTPTRERTAAVVVTYHPDPGFTERARAMSAVAARLFVIDNSTRNRGLAAALNEGFRAAGAAGFEWVIAFDQDSQPLPGIVAAAAAAVAAATREGEAAARDASAARPGPGDRVAVIGAGRVGQRAPAAALVAGFIRCEHVITSGSVHSLAAFHDVGEFREELFIDLVDVEWCRRARRRGWQVLLSPEPSLQHAVGQPSGHRLLGRPTATSNHPPARRYYMTRNTLALAREGVRREPGFAIELAVGLLKSLVLMLRFETDRGAKLKMAARGARDGIAGRLGPGPLTALAPDRGDGRARTRRVPRILMALAAAGLSLALADGLLRVTVGPRLFNRPDDGLLERRPDLPQLYRYRPGSEFHRTSIGDLAAMSGDARLGEPRHIDFRVDARGFRNPPGTSLAAATVLVLGDSFSVGTGSTDGRGWGERLGRDGTRRVYNLATPSTPWQEYITLAAELRREPPRPGTFLLWQLFPANDLDDPIWGDTLELDELPWRGPLGQLAVTASTFAHRSPLLRLARALRADGGEARALVIERRFLDGRPMLFHASYAARVRRDATAIRSHPKFPRLERTLGAMRELAAHHGLRLAIVLAPAKEEVYSWLLEGAEPWAESARAPGASEAIRERAEQEGIAVLDLGPALRRASRAAWEDRGELLYWRDDTHWSESGHALVADLVERDLMR